MTAAADRRACRTPGPKAVGLVVAVLAGAMVLLSACGSDQPGSTGQSSTGPVPGGTRTAAPADEAAIRATIEEFNSTAGGPVQAQQAALAAVVDPQQHPAEPCPAATRTIRFEPVYQALRAAPGWLSAGRVPAGVVYALPTLIRTYSADRSTGTDLATLHLNVVAGTAYLTPLCIG